MFPTKCLPEFIALAHRLAEASGEVIRRYFRASINVEGKGDLSPVTIADREAEQAIRALLAKERPNDGIWGEEFGKERMDAEYVWVIDPIDGTRAFVTGKPVFGTLIALMREGEPVLGIIDQPVLRERWIGALGHPTQLNGKECRVRSCPSLEQAVVNLSPNTSFETEKGMEPFRNIARVCKTTSMGGDCYVYGLLASGFVDLIVETGLKLHDFAALVPVVTGAGGKVTDWHGQPLGMHSKGEVLASGDPRVAQTVVEILRAVS